MGVPYFWQVRAANSAGVVYANDAAWWSFSTAGADELNYWSGIAFHFSEVATALNRSVRNANNVAGSTGSVARSEGGAPTGDDDEPGEGEVA